MLPRVLVVGDIVTDILAVHSGRVAVGSDTEARISVTGGGSAANTAAWLVQAGARADIVAVAGTDASGDERLVELAAAGVGCASVRRTTEAPTGTIIVLAQGSERSFLCDRGANLLLQPSDVDAALEAAPDAAHVHVSGYTLLDPSSRAAGRHALAAAMARGLSTSVDAASAAPLLRLGGQEFLEWVRGVEIVLANLGEAHALLDDRTAAADDLARGLATAAQRFAVVKLGAEGSVWAGHEGSVVRHAAEPAPVVVDSTGAGDAFAAGLLSAWLTGAQPAEAMRAGARLGAVVVGLIGGRPARR